MSPDRLGEGTVCSSAKLRALLPGKAYAAEGAGKG